MLGLGSAGAAVALCVESRVTEASATVVRPTAGVVRPRVRGLRCDAKAGISFRGPPTGLAMGVPPGRSGTGGGFGRNGRLPYGPVETDRFTPVLRVGPRFRAPFTGVRIRRGCPCGAVRLKGVRGTRRSTLTTS